MVLELKRRKRYCKKEQVKNIIDGHEDLGGQDNDHHHGDRLHDVLRANLVDLRRHAQHRIGGHEAGNEGHGHGEDGQLPPAESNGNVDVIVDAHGVLPPEHVPVAVVAPTGPMRVSNDPVVVALARRPITDQDDGVIIQLRIPIGEEVHDRISSVVHELAEAGVNGHSNGPISLQGGHHLSVGSRPRDELKEVGHLGQRIARGQPRPTAAHRHLVGVLGVAVEAVLVHVLGRPR
ncbi:hypothetical protein TYRP_003046 [Tyrophagus putrescentiae]|nr:hypothetical protein TYRP_003046 [Tyrophagus putrescentiae]